MVIRSVVGSKVVFHFP